MTLVCSACERELRRDPKPGGRPSITCSPRCSRAWASARRRAGRDLERALSALAELERNVERLRAPRARRLARELRWELVGLTPASSAKVVVVLDGGAVEFVRPHQGKSREG